MMLLFKYRAENFIRFLGNNTRAMTEPLPRKTLRPEEWEWNGDKDPLFHRKVVSPLLETHYEKLVSDGKLGRFFFPLCGKTQDMIFCANKGHDVVGLEFSEVGIECFFKENNLTYEKGTLKDAPFAVYKCMEKNITIYNGDLFKFDPKIVDKFDYLYDRGSYIAINVPTQTQYSDLMFSLMKPTGKILMEAIEYDTSMFGGPAHSIPIENLQSTFGRKCNIEALDVIVRKAPWYYKLDTNMDIHPYLISFK